jgi:hypothetical protein
MEYWEFLLQKEGDDSWLPLDASQVEILEGRYRIMAHTSQAHTPVQIQISQMLHDRLPPKRRRLHRRGETNATGLMVVMPFTRLQEGTWEIQCAGEAPSATAEDNNPLPPWHYAVQLQVVAQGTADDDDWFADDGRAGIGGTPPTATPGSSPAIAASGPPVDLDAAAVAMEAFQTQLAAGHNPGPQPYRLTLPSTALLSGEGEAVSLLAIIDRSPESSLELTPDRIIPPPILVVRLSDPQTAAPVSLTSTPVTTATLPANLTLTVSVPTGLSTRLLLGEVALLVGPAVAALQQFTVTVDVAALFNAIANQAETETGLGIVFPVDDANPPGSFQSNSENYLGDNSLDDSSAPPRPDLKTWETVVGRSAPYRAMPIVTLPRSSPELPPRIYYPSPHEAATRQPSLPQMGQPPASAPTPERQPTQSNDTLSASTPGNGGEAPLGLSLPPLPAQPRREDPLAGLQPPPVGTSKPSSRPQLQLISHEAMGFKDLKLQERFWNRLNALATNLQQEALENRAAEAELKAPTTPDNTPEPEPDAVEKFVPFAGEVVIYEDEDPTLRTQPTIAPTPPTPHQGEPTEVITPPRPVLILPEGDLTAGELVNVTLRVPFHPNRIYLKIWITDPQTRTLADEPRQIMNLLPNGQGQLEGSLQLTVPMGCLEAWFEAIAVDMVTLQESYKASISRTITPADLSTSSLDEFHI